MTLDTASALLQAAETSELRLRAIVLIDWHDGPLEGIAELAEPVSCWHFRMLGERRRSDDLDDRTYLLARVAEQAMERMTVSATPIGEPPLVCHSSSDQMVRKLGKPWTMLLLLLNR